MRAKVRLDYLLLAEAHCEGGDLGGVKPAELGGTILVGADYGAAGEVAGIGNGDGVLARVVERAAAGGGEVFGNAEEMQGGGEAGFGEVQGLVEMAGDGHSEGFIAMDGAANQAPGLGAGESGAIDQADTRDGVEGEREEVYTEDGDGGAELLEYRGGNPPGVAGQGRGVAGHNSL